MPTPRLIQHKLENALAAWIEANKGDLLPSVAIVPGRTKSEPAMPFLAVNCLRARPHPDFEGCGRAYPQLVPAVFHFRKNALDDGTHDETIAEWIGQLDELLRTPLAEGAEEYSKLVTALNPPEAGEDQRAQKELYLYAVHPDEDVGDFDGEVWDEMLALEIVAQNGDPTPG